MSRSVPLLNTGWHRQGTTPSCSFLAVGFCLFFHHAGIPAYVVVPRTAPHCKQAAICSYGATLVPCDPSDTVRD